MKRRRTTLWIIALLTLAGAGVYWSIGSRHVRTGALRPWDGHADLSLITLKLVREIDTHGFSSGMTEDGPMGSIEYHIKNVAAAGRDLFEGRTARPAWVFWWDRDGEPQNTLHLNGPPMFAAPDAAPHPWADANSDGIWATVRSGEYPLRVMIIEPGKAAADKSRALRFIDEALDQRLSEDQVVQILEIAHEIGSLDPPAVAKLNDISQGKVPLQTVQTGGTNGVSTIGPGTAAAPDEDYADLKRRAGEIAARFGPPNNSVEQRLADPATAIKACDELIGQPRPPNASKLMHEAAMKSPTRLSLTIAARIAQFDPAEAARTRLDLMTVSDSDVRHYAWENGLNWMGPLDALGIDHDYVKSKFDAIKDPAIRAEWMKTVVPQCVPEIISRRDTEKLLNGKRRRRRLDPADPQVRQVVLEAVKADDVKSLAALVDHGAAVDSAPPVQLVGAIRGRTLLPQAAVADAARSVQFLLDHQVTAEATLAAELAIYSHRAKALKVLLDWGVSPRAQTAAHTPLILLPFGPEDEIQRLLREADAREQASGRSHAASTTSPGAK